MPKGKSQRKKNASLQNLEPQNAAEVKAGVAFSPLVATRIATVNKGGGNTGGGHNNEPAARFQAILGQIVQQPG